MRILWMLMLFISVIISMPTAQHAMAEETRQSTQLGISVGSGGITIALKMPLATDATLKPGDYVNLYVVEQKKGLLSDKPIAQDVWIAGVVAEKIKVIAIDRSEPVDPSEFQISRMVRLEVDYKVMRRFAYQVRTNRDNFVIGLAGHAMPNICGDCDVMSRADYNDQYGRECSIKTRRGGQVMAVRIPCPKN